MKRCYACQNPDEQKLSNGGCTKIQTPIPYCDVYKDNTTCEQCLKTYMVSDGKCLKDSSGCANYSSIGVCQQCGFGTSLIQGACRGILNCDKYLSKGNNTFSCMNCTVGFSNSFGLSCYAADSCLSNLASGGCTECAQGFVLSGYMCFSMGDLKTGCDILHYNKTCMYCLEGYANRNGDCVLADYVMMWNQTFSMVQSTVTTVSGGVAAGSTAPVSTASQSATPVTTNSIITTVITTTPGTPINTTSGTPITTTLQAQSPASISVTETSVLTNTSANSAATLANTTTATNSAVTATNTATNSATTLKNETATANTSINLPSIPPQSQNISTVVDIQNGSAPNQIIVNKTTTTTTTTITTRPGNATTTNTTDNNQIINNNTGIANTTTAITATTATTATTANTTNNVVTTTNASIIPAPQPPKLPPNCIKQDPFTKMCLVCTPPYFLNQNNECVTVSPNCIEYNPNNATCLQCKKGWGLDKLNQCVQMQSDPNCLVQSYRGCDRCLPSYQLINFKCVSISPLCLSYSPKTGQCISCIADHEIYNQTCMKKLAKCLKRDDTNVTACLQCQTNYELNNNKQCISYCIEFDSNFRCITCARRYSLNNFTCRIVQNYDDQCLKYVNEGCTLCIPPSYVIAGRCTNAFCQTSNGIDCQKCQLGYEKSVLGCVKILIPFCLETNLNKCIKCENGFTLDNGMCIYNTLFCQSYDLKTARCQKCQQGYRLLDNLCIPEFCQMWSGTICTRCLVGYNLENTLCKKIMVSGCLTYSDRCLQCQQNLTLVDNMCVSKVMGCISYGQDGKCRECRPGMILNVTMLSLQCQDVLLLSRYDPYCLKTATNGRCQQCFPQYYVGVNGECLRIMANCKNVSGNTCFECNSGYYKSNDGFCVIVNGLCATYNYTTGYCLTCFAGYVLNSTNYCVIGNPNCKQYVGTNCAVCSAGYYLKDNQCLLVSPLCATADPMNGDCLSCYLGYVLSQGQCIIRRQDNNCRTYRGTQCIQCSQSFYMSGGRCLPQNPQCKTVNVENGACTTCYIGFMLQNGSCVQPRNEDPNCLQNSGTLCLYCRDRFWLSDGKCVPLTRNCQTYEQTTGRCLTCSSDFLVENGDCVRVAGLTIRNCVRLGSDGQCAACVSNYYLKNGGCQLVDMLCLTFDYNQNMCLQCQPGYFLQDGGCIYPSLGYDPYCQRYSGSFCQRCRQGYYISNYICLKVHSNCTQFNYERQQCVQCRVGRPEGAICI